MVGKAKSIAHTRAAINYALKKDKAIELMKEKVIGQTGKEIAEEFRMYQQLNHNCKNNTISVVLSPAVENGRQLKKNALREITLSYLKKIGLQDHQFAAYVHNDREHKHIHLFINRITSQGKAFNDSYVGKKTQRIADEIAQEHNLIRARIVEKMKDQALKYHKAKARAIHQDVMRTYPENFGNYKKAMHEKGANIKSHFKKGILVGFSVEINNVWVKASKISQSMTLKKIEPLFKEALLKNKERLIIKNRKLRR